MEFTLSNDFNQMTQRAIEVMTACLDDEGGIEFKMEQFVAVAKDQSNGHHDLKGLCEVMFGFSHLAFLLVRDHCEQTGESESEVMQRVALRCHLNNDRG